MSPETELKSVTRLSNGLPYPPSHLTDLRFMIFLEYSWPNLEEGSILKFYVALRQGLCISDSPRPM